MEGGGRAAVRRQQSSSSGRRPISGRYQLHPGRSNRTSAPRTDRMGVTVDFGGRNRNRNRKLLISRAPTKAKSQEPANSQGLNQNKIDRQRSRSRESGKQTVRRLWWMVSDGGALVEATSFDRRVVGSNPALAAM